MKQMLEKRTNLYLSGPMTGKPDFNHPLFNMIARVLRKQGYGVFNPAELPGSGSGADWISLMRMCLLKLPTTDGLVMLPGWLTSRGALIEVLHGHVLQKDFYTFKPWLGDIEPFTVDINEVLNVFKALENRGNPVPE